MMNDVRSEPTQHQSAHNQNCQQCTLHSLRCAACLAALGTWAEGAQKHVAQLPKARDARASSHGSPNFDDVATPAERLSQNFH